jgi:hypothetical protein
VPSVSYSSSDFCEAPNTTWRDPKASREVALSFTKKGEGKIGNTGVSFVTPLSIPSHFFIVVIASSSFLNARVPFYEFRNLICEFSFYKAVTFARQTSNLREVAFVVEILKRTMRDLRRKTEWSRRTKPVLLVCAGDQAQK